MVQRMTSNSNRRDWPVAAKLTAFAMVLALSFGVGAAVGAAVGPEPSAPTDGPGLTDHNEPSMPHGDGHGG
jgi:hypothetical protein